MKLKTVFFNVSILLLVFSSVAASTPATGILLRQDVFARSSGLGETFTAVSGDIASVSYNPAGLYGIGKNGLSFSYSTKLVDSQLGFAGYTHAFGLNTLLIGISYLDTGNIQFDFTSGRSYSRRALQESVVTVGYAGQIFKRFLLGLSLKQFSSSLMEQYNVKSQLIDAGCIYLTPLSGLSIGVAQQNSGSKVRYYDQDEPLPQQLRYGISYKAILKKGKEADEFVTPPTTINIAADMLNDIEGYNYTSMGMEFGYGIATFRAGSKTGENMKAYGIGFGFNILTGVVFDYALGLPADLAPFHNLSLKINW